MSLYGVRKFDLQDEHMKTGENRTKEKIKISFSFVFTPVKGVLSVLFALHRAFEDDDCLAVIEQCPNTSARPPGPSLVTVQMEPTSLDVQGDPGLAPDNHSVTVETYSEPVLDTKV